QYVDIKGHSLCVPSLQRLLHQVQRHFQLVGRLVGYAAGKLKQISCSRIERRILAQQERRRTDARVLPSAAKIQIKMVDAQNSPGIELDLLAVLRTAGHEEMMFLYRTLIVRSEESPLPRRRSLRTKLLFQNAFISRFVGQTEIRIS